MTSNDATLADILIDGFEKNEVIDGFHWRDLPMRDESSASRKFGQLAEEARRWKGVPQRFSDDGPRRIAAWSDLEIRQMGRGIMVRVRAPWFSTWWNAAETWRDDPMGPLRAWIEEETDSET